MRYHSNVTISSPSACTSRRPRQAMVLPLPNGTCFYDYELAGRLPMDHNRHLLQLAPLRVLHCSLSAPSEGAFRISRQ